MNSGDAGTYRFLHGFRDYVYIRLGGNRVSHKRVLFNIFVTFLVSGLWHGAQWTFVAWGALHGFYLIIALYIPHRVITHVPYFIRMLCTFGSVCFAWIFFRANTLHDAAYIIQNLFTNITTIENVLLLRRAVVSGRSLDVHYLLLLSLGVWVWQAGQAYVGHIRYALTRIPSYARLAVYYAAATLLFLFGEFSGQQFIYFQF